MVTAAPILAGLAAVAAAPGLLGRLNAAVVRLQAERWSAANLAIRTGYVSQAGLAYEAWPERRVRQITSLGRRWWSRAVWLDVMGVMRTPARMVSAIAMTVLAGIWLTRVVIPGGLGGFAGVALAALMSILAAGGIGSLADGLRHVAEDASAPSSYGVSTTRLFAAHAVVPLVGGLVALALGGLLGGPIGAAVAVVMGAVNAGGVPEAAEVGGVAGAAGAQAWMAAVIIWLATVVVLMCLDTINRVRLGAPGLLYTPMSTPMGDPAPILRAAWQIWPQLAAAAWGMAIALVSSASRLWPGLVILVVVAVWSVWRCLKSLTAMAAPPGGRGD
jgi:hypothetical protein